MGKTTRPVIVITGASGFVGSQLVQDCAHHGWQVRALVRNPQAMPAVKHVSYIAYDLGQEPSDEAFAGADYLVHAAYIKEDRKHPDAFALNVTGTKKLLAASRKHKLRKNIFISSMSAHAEAVSGYGKQKFELEKLFSSKHDAVVRSGLVIGNGGLIKQIAQFMRTKHVAPLIDGGDQPLQVVGVADLTRVIIQIIEQDHYGIFTIGTPEVYSYREFYLMLSRQLGVKVFIIPVPFWLPLYTIRLIHLLHVPLGITEDNLWGLKKLQAFETLPDLQKLHIHLATLDQLLDQPDLHSDRSYK